MTIDVITRAALSLGLEERQKLAIQLGQSIRADTPVSDRDVAHGIRYRDLMEQLLGCRIITPTRQTDVAYARMIVSSVMSIRGFTTNVISSVIGRHRTSCTYYNKMVSNFLKYPKQYPREAALYGEYVELLEKNNL